MNERFLFIEPNRNKKIKASKLEKDTVIQASNDFFSKQFLDNEINSD